MTEYEKFSEELKARVEKKKERDALKKVIMIILECFLPFLACLFGTVILQLGWGQFKLVKLFWGLTAVVLGVTIWYVIQDVQFFFEKE